MDLYILVFVMPGVPPVAVLCFAAAYYAFQRPRWTWFGWTAVALLGAVLVTPAAWLAWTGIVTVRDLDPIFLTGYLFLAPLVALHGMYVGVFMMYVVLHIGRLRECG